jgi:hypothetical protein
MFLSKNEGADDFLLRVGKWDGQTPTPRKRGRSHERARGAFRGFAPTRAGLLAAMR